MKRSLVIVFWLWAFSSVFGQKRIDSLLQEVRKPAVSDSLRAHLYNELAFEYAIIQPAIGHTYADSAWALAQDLQEASLATSAINYKGINYWYQGEDSLALIHFEQVLDAHRRSGYKKGQASVINNIALIQYNRANYREAIQSHEAATAIFKELGLKKNIINSLSNTGVVFLALADYPKAQEYFLQALASTQDSDYQERCQLFINLGLVQKNRAAYEEAESYYYQALEIAEKEGLKQSEASILGNLSAVKQLQGDLLQAESYIRKALEVNRSIGNKRRIASDFSTLGIIEMENEDLDAAEKYLDSARSFYLEVGEILNLSKVLLQLSDVWQMQSKSQQKVLALQQEAVKLAEQSGSLEAQQAAWLALSESLESVGSYQSSLEAYRRYKVFQDSIFNDENERKLIGAQIGYEFEAKEKELKAGFEAEKRVLESEKEQARLRSSLYLIGIMGLLLLAGISYFSLRQQNKSRREKLEAEFRTQAAELELKALKAQINPHFIFNALSSISNFLLKNQSVEADRYLTKFSKLIRRILEFSEQKEISLQEEIDLLHDYIALEALRLGKNVNFSVRLGAGIAPEQLMIPPLLLQPLVENSLWHGISPMEHAGEIVLFGELENDALQLILQDNGVGMQDAFPTRQKHQSMGMNLVKNRLANLQSRRQGSEWLMSWRNLSPGFEIKLTCSPYPNFEN